jgi:hypothetical protein
LKTVLIHWHDLQDVTLTNNYTLLGVEPKNSYILEQFLRKIYAYDFQVFNLNIKMMLVVNVFKTIDRRYVQNVTYFVKRRKYMISKTYVWYNCTDINSLLYSHNNTIYEN